VGWIVKTLKELLDEHHTIASFDNGDIDILSGISKIVELEQGELLFQDQDSGDSVYLVISGSIDMFTRFNENLDQTIMTVRAGGFVGAMAMMDDEVRGINARAAEQTEVYKFDCGKLQLIIAANNSLSSKLLRLFNAILSQRLRIAMNSLRQNVEWTMQVSGLASLDISQLIVDQVNIVIHLVNGHQLAGVIVKAEEHPSGFELFVKTSDNNLHFIPYHAIVSASLPLDVMKSNPDSSFGM
jgi:CRP-like cAMP-binding protein